MDFDTEMALAIQASLAISDPLPAGNLLNYVSPSVTPPKKGRVVIVSSDDEDEPTPRVYVPPRPPTREEMEQRARTVSKIEETYQAIEQIRKPMADAKKRVKELRALLIAAKQEVVEYNRQYTEYTKVLDNRTNIMEHQNIEYARAQMMDVYGIDVTKSKEEEKEEEVEVIPTPIPVSVPTPIPVSVPIPTLDGVEGTPVRIRLVYPNGQREDVTTNSMQTIEGITKYACAVYKKHLRMAGIPGLTLTPTSTLQELGLVSSAVFKFRE